MIDKQKLIEHIEKEIKYWKENFNSGDDDIFAKISTLNLLKFYIYEGKFDVVKK